MEIDYSILRNFAFCGTSENFNQTIEYLALIAEEEVWSFGDKPLTILIKYINGTFRQCYKQNKILYTKDHKYACFNTGLLTPNCNDIIGLFEVNLKPDGQPWFFKGFKEKSDKFFMNLFATIPKLATYTDNYEDYYFNPYVKIEINIDHILDDNYVRLKKIIDINKTVFKTLLQGAFEESKKRIERNLRLVIPQFYNDEIMYLLPINIPIGEDKYLTMALAIQKTETNQYRANTLFTKEIAYEKARLLMKLDSFWLI